MIMPIFKYFETELAKKEMVQIKKSLQAWIEMVQSHTNINKNTMFET